MANKLIERPKEDNIYISVITSEKFTELGNETQKELLKKLEERDKREGGVLGKLFGTNKDLAAMNTSFIIIVLLLLIGVICMCCGYDHWNVIFPLATTAIGYFFGAGAKKS